MLSHPANVKRDFVKLSKRFFCTALDFYDFVPHVEHFMAMTRQLGMLGKDERIIVISDAADFLAERSLLGQLGGRPKHSHALS